MRDRSTDALTGQSEPRTRAGVGGCRWVTAIKGENPLLAKDGPKGVPEAGVAADDGVGHDALELKAGLARVQRDQQHGRGGPGHGPAQRLQQHKPTRGVLLLCSSHVAGHPKLQWALQRHRTEQCMLYPAKVLSSKGPIQQGAH